MVITNAVLIGIRGAVAATNANGICLIAIAIAVSWRYGFTATIVNGPRSVTDTTGIYTAYTRVNIVTNPIQVRITGARSTADTKGVELVSIAIAISLWNARTSALFDWAGSVADVAGIQDAYARVILIADVV